MAADALAAECRDLVQVYESAAGPVHALRGVSAQFPARAMTAVQGPSGAGKSTLLRLLACLEKPTVGEVVVAGRPTAHLSGRRRRQLVAHQIGYVFQAPEDNLFDYMTATQHVRMAWRMRAPEPRGAVAALLERTGLERLGAERPAALSAGEQQCLAFAMAVAGRPALVIADEPTASLDPAGARALVETLPGLVAEGQAFVICTHDRTVTEAADQVLAVRDGTIAGRATADGEMLAVVDDAGRVQLPRHTADLFPRGLARISAGPDHVRLDPP